MQLLIALISCIPIAAVVICISHLKKVPNKEDTTKKVRTFKRIRQTPRMETGRIKTQNEYYEMEGGLKMPKNSKETMGVLLGVAILLIALILALGSNIS